MKIAIIFLGVLSAAAAAPFNFFHPGVGQGGSATGSAAGNVVSGFSQGPFGNSRVTQVSAQAQGSTRGNGSSNNRATASHVGVDSPFGSSQFSNTDAFSNQGSFGSFGGSRRQIGHLFG